MVVGPVRFEVAGVLQLSRILSRFADGVEDLEPAFEQIADDFLEIEQRQFESEGSSGSGGWQELAPSTRAQKARRYPGRRILVASGRMEKSLTERGGEHIRELSPLELRLGSSVTSDSGFPYPLAHQRGWGNLPTRPPIQLSEANRREWTRFVQRYLVGLVRGGGLRAARRPSLRAGAEAVLD